MSIRSNVSTPGSGQYPDASITESKIAAGQIVEDHFHSDLATTLDAALNTTASSAELNLADGSVAGTAVASKLLCLGADKNVDTIAVADGGFKLGSGAGTAVTSTAAELNELDDVTSFAQSTIAVGAETGGDTIAVTLTLKDAAGVAVNEARYVRCWLSSSATTGALSAAPSGGVTATTGIILKEDTAELLFQCVTSTAGVLVLSIVEAGALNSYLWVELPNGKSLVSGVIAHAA